MKNKPFLILFLSIIAICLAVILLSRHAASGGKTAKVYQDGVLIHTIDLSAVTAPYEIEVNDGDNKNTVQVDHNQISMKAANCPDQLCVRQGAISSAVYPVVCLPHKVVIEIVGGDDSSDIDAISGRDTE